jgi:FMN phosphatase YigB (HAD superfamily)
MGKYRFLPDDAIMVGDRDIDILSAQNAKVHSCYFTNGSEPSKVAVLANTVEMFTVKKEPTPIGYRPYVKKRDASD